MKEIKKYIELKKRIEKLEEEQEKYKEKIINKCKKNKKDFIEDQNYIINVSFPQKIIYEIKKAKRFFEKNNLEDCLIYKVDNTIVKKYEKQGKINSKKLNSFRKFKLGNPRLYVNEK